MPTWHGLLHCRTCNMVPVKILRLPWHWNLWQIGVPGWIENMDFMMDSMCRWSLRTRIRHFENRWILNWYQRRLLPFVRFFVIPVCGWFILTWRVERKSGWTECLFNDGNLFLDTPKWMIDEWIASNRPLMNLWFSRASSCTGLEPENLFRSVCVEDKIFSVGTSTHLEIPFIALGIIS